MSDAWASAPSPCIDVCKYKRQGRCVGCAMTEMEKAAFPRAGSGAAKRAFFEALVARMGETMRNTAFWASAYRRKCAQEGVRCPLDEGEG